MLTVKNNWYKILIATVLLVAIVVCTYRACNHAQPVSTTSAKSKVIPKQIPKSYIAPSGTVHTETKVVQAEHDNLLEEYYMKLLADAKKELAIKDKQLKDVIAASITTEGTITFPIYREEEPSIDSAARPIKVYDCPEDIRYFQYKDKFIKLVGRVDQDSIDVSYKVEDSIHLVTYWKRKNFLSAKELYVNGFSTNPNTNIKGLQMVKINQATPKKWAVGINAGYYFDGSGFRPGIGIGLTKTIFRF
ncbi:DUF6549 family protein [Sediminibacterium sp.]|uniref:DUF6549 family protein n=1 Tax=Sediminibacterium sp. TaxID=1917865 RepID=UPI003F6A3594